MATKKKTGRPEAKIDPEDVRKLSSYGCSNVEIADFCGCSESTIRLRFSDILLKERADLKGKLRKAQVFYALKGNATLLIWLGKNMLGQSDGENEKGLSETELTKLREIIKTQIDANI